MQIKFAKRKEISVVLNWIIIYELNAYEPNKSVHEYHHVEDGKKKRKRAEKNNR